MHTPYCLRYLDSLTDQRLCSIAVGLIMGFIFGTSTSFDNNTL